MKISFDWGGCYLEHRQYFDEVAKGLQRMGHKVGILTGERDSKAGEIRGSLGFFPDFMILWPEFQTIANGAKWKADRMVEHEIMVHHDDDATDIKKWTELWVIKVMNSAQVNKF